MKENDVNFKENKKKKKTKKSQTPSKRSVEPASNFWYDQVRRFHLKCKIGMVSPTVFLFLINYTNINF